MVSDCGRLGNSGVGPQPLECLAHDRSNFLSQQCCALWSSQVCPDRICAPTFCTDVVDQRFCFLCGAAIMNQDVRPGLGKGRCRRAAYSSRCAGHKRGFVLECIHCPLLTSSTCPAMQCCRTVHAFIPPSTVIFAQVMYDEPGPATNDTSAATSSTFP